jgi:hypothetical protein
VNDEEMDELVFVWDEYAKQDESTLTKDAIKLKQEVRRYVRSLPAPKFVKEQVG